MPSPTYLIQTQYGYYYRHKVPPDLRHLVGKTELRYSVNTGKFSLAKSRARMIAGMAQNLFRKLRYNNKIINNGDTMSNILKKSDIQAIIEGYVKQSLDDDIEQRVNSHPRSMSKVDQQYDDTKDLQIIYKESLASNDLRHADSHAKLLLEDAGKTTDYSSESYKLLCHSLMRANVKILEILKHRELGDYEYEESVIPQQQLSSSPAPPQEETDSLQEVLNLYLSEKEPTWEPRTMEKNLNLLRMLTFYFGEDFPIQKIDYRQMQGFKRFLIKVPVGFFKTKKYKGMTKDDVLSLPDGKDKTIAPKTINMYIGAIITMFTFAMRNGYTEKNYAEGLKIPLKKKPQDQRDLFNPEDLNKLFNSPDYTNDTHEKPFQFPPFLKHIQILRILRKIH